MTLDRFGCGEDRKRRSACAHTDHNKAQNAFLISYSFTPSSQPTIQTPTNGEIRPLVTDVPVKFEILGPSHTEDRQKKPCEAIRQGQGCVFTPTAIAVWQFRGGQATCRRGSTRDFPLVTQGNRAPSARAHCPCQQFTQATASFATLLGRCWPLCLRRLPRCLETARGYLLQPCTSRVAASCAVGTPAGVTHTPEPSLGGRKACPPCGFHLRQIVNYSRGRLGIYHKSMKKKNRKKSTSPLKGHADHIGPGQLCWLLGLEG